ncbi:MAG TPA: fibronectin type III domain-containing protein [Pseudobdellovibrionaceae bacterium]|nr:fibronectin type III domain-containing protein [Pseudobdellovibrionaceae bacterium]
MKNKKLGGILDRRFVRALVSKSFTLSILGVFSLWLNACTFEATITKIGNGGGGGSADQTPPDFSGVVTDGSLHNSITQSPLLSWPVATDSASAISRYEVALGTTSSGADVLSWTSVGNVTSTTLTGLSLISGQVYYVSVRAVDAAGNISVPLVGDGWIADAQGPDVSGVSLNDGTENAPTTQSPLLSWNAAVDTASGISHYELALGTSSGGTELQTWTSVGNVTSATLSGVTLSRGTFYYVSLRAIDTAGNTSSVVLGDGFFVTPELWTTNGTVLSILRSGDNIYLGGNFTQVGPWSGGFAPVDTTTGAVSWGSQKARVAGSVFISISDGAGGHYIGGSFTAVGGIARNNVAHILSDGSLDLNFNPNTDGEIDTMALSGSNLYLGGAFTTVGGGSGYFAPIDLTTGDWLPGH